MILCVLLPYLKLELFQKKGKYLNEAEIKDVRENILETVLDFLYTGTVLLTSETVDDIKAASMRLNINRMSHVQYNL